VGVLTDNKTRTEQMLALEPTTWWVPRNSALENRLVLVLTEMVRFALLQPEGESQPSQGKVAGRRYPARRPRGRRIETDR